MEINTRYDYVSLELAKVLRASGFDWPVTSYYQHGIFYEFSIDRSRIICTNKNNAPVYMEQFSAPTLEVANKYLRLVMGFHVQVEYTPWPKRDENGKFIEFEPRWMFHIVKIGKGTEGMWHSMSAYESPEEALQNGLLSAYKSVKQYEDEKGN